MYNSVSERWNGAFSVMKTKSLWFLVGLNLVLTGVLLLSLRSVMVWILPVLITPVLLVLDAGLSGIYLRIVRGEKAEIVNLFDAFKDTETLKRVAGGSLWKTLLLMLWTYLPLLVIGFGTVNVVTIIGALTDAVDELMSLWILFMLVWMIVAMVIMVIKDLEYSFTLYILISRPEVKAMDAVKESGRLTKGLRGRIFCAVFLPALVISLVYLALAFLSFLPLIGPMFRFAMRLLMLAYGVFYPVFSQLVLAGFYNAAVSAPAQCADGAQNVSEFPQSQNSI